MRSRAGLHGLAGLSLDSCQRVLAGNALCRIAAEVALERVRIGIPSVLENPLSSLMRVYPSALALLDRAGVIPADLGHCQFGEPWTKPPMMCSRALIAVMLSARHFGHQPCV